MPGGIVVTGGGGQLKHIIIRYITGYDPRVGLPKQYLPKTISEDTNQPMYSTAIGLIIMGLNKTTLNIMWKRGEVREYQSKQFEVNRLKKLEQF